jgi:hypothetical protein
MRSSGSYPLQGFVEIDETVVGRQEEGARGRKNQFSNLQNNTTNDNIN